MKNRYLHISALITVLALCTQSVNAQQGFGTNQPHKSAAIDIKSNSRGLLIPRVTLRSLTSQSPIATPVAEGLLIYNIGDSSDTNYNVDKGFYYWYNGKWNSFLTSLNSESTDDQVIESFEITADHKLKIQIEGDSDTHEVDLTPYVNKSYTLSSSGNNMILSVDGIALPSAASIISDNTLSIENGTNNAKNLQSSVNGEVSSIDITNLIRTEQITYSLVDGTNTTAELVTDTANAKSYKVNVAPATTSSLGVVKIGSGFEETTDGTLNVDFPDHVADINTSISNLQTDGKLIGTYINEVETPFQIKETVTSLSYVDNQLIYTNETGTQAGIPIVGEDTKTQLTNGNYTTVSLEPSGATFLNNATNTYKVDVNVATKPENGVATYGVVKPGDGLSIAENGTLKVDFPTDNNTTYTAGTGITLTGTQFNVPVNVSGGGNVITGVTASASGLDFSTSQIATTDTTYTGGDGITLEGTVFSVPVTTTGTGNVITNVEHTTDGITVTKALIATTDTKTIVSGASGVEVTPTVNTQDTSVTDYKVAVKYAMPQVFYMPAMLFNAQAGQTYSNVDLYAHYVDQFATPFKSSAGASGMIPHVAAANQLEYYITYADPSILPDSITITADGKLTYSVGTGSQESFAYMTVVFVVKPNAVITVPTTP